MGDWLGFIVGDVGSIEGDGVGFDDGESLGISVGDTFKSYRYTAHSDSACG